jgi:hypothetical protein
MANCLWNDDADSHRTWLADNMLLWRKILLA